MSRRSLLRRTGFAAITLLLLCTVPETVFAQSLGVSQSFISGALLLVSFLLTILNFIAWFLLMLLHYLINPEVIFDLKNGGASPLLEMLRNIWQFSRDLVNIGFAIGLIIGAIIMIVTADGTKVKEHLPKFVIGLILVNFSWFIPRVIFDATQVVTYTVYQLPSLIGDNGCRLPPRENETEVRPCEVVVEFRFFQQTRTLVPDGAAVDGVQRLRDRTDPNSTGWICPLGLRQLVCIQKLPMDQLDSRVSSPTRVLDGLVVNHARLQWLLEIQPEAAASRLGPGTRPGDAFLTVLTTLMKMIVVLILHVAIVFPLAAMTAAFFIRIPVLWVSMAFMPLIALGFAFPKLREGDYGDLFWKWQERFLQAVLLPLRVAIPFTIGLILLNAGSLLPAPDSLGTIPLLPIFVQVRDLWQFLWMGIALFIIWKYSFEQLSSEKAGEAGFFTEKIKAFGGSLGSLALQAPLSAPFIPVRGRDGEVGRASILGQAERFGPRRIAEELRAQRRFEVGSATPTGAGGAREKTATNFIQNNNPTINIAVEQLQRAVADNRPETIREAFEQLEKNTDARAALGGLSRRQVLDLILNNPSSGISDPQRIRKLAEDNAARLNLTSTIPTATTP